MKDSLLYFIRLLIFRNWTFDSSLSIHIFKASNLWQFCISQINFDITNYCNQQHHHYRLKNIQFPPKTNYNAQHKTYIIKHPIKLVIAKTFHIHKVHSYSTTVQYQILIIILHVCNIYFINKLNYYTFTCIYFKITDSTSKSIIPS